MERLDRFTNLRVALLLRVRHVFWISGLTALRATSPTRHSFFKLGANCRPQRNRLQNSAFLQFLFAQLLPLPGLVEAEAVGLIVHHHAHEQGATFVALEALGGARTLENILFHPVREEARLGGELRAAGAKQGI